MLIDHPNGWEVNNAQTYYMNCRFYSYRIRKGTPLNIRRSKPKPEHAKSNEQIPIPQAAEMKAVRVPQYLGTIEEDHDDVPQLRTTLLRVFDAQCRFCHRQNPQNPDLFV